MFWIFFFFCAEIPHIYSGRENHVSSSMCDMVITQSQNGDLKRSPVQSLGQCRLTHFCSCTVIFGVATEGFLTWSVQWWELKNHQEKQNGECGSTIWWGQNSAEVFTFQGNVLCRNWRLVSARCFEHMLNFEGGSASLGGLQALEVRICLKPLQDQFLGAEYQRQWVSGAQVCTLVMQCSI